MTQFPRFCHCWLCLIGLVGLSSAAAQESTPAREAEPPAVATPANAASTEREEALIRRSRSTSFGTGFEEFDTAAGPALMRYIKTQASPAKGAVLILPGSGVPITSLALVQALAEEFPPNGWSLLAIQLPLLPRSAELVDYAASEGTARARFETGVARIARDGIEQIAVVALDNTAAWVARWLAQTPGRMSVKAFISGGQWSGASPPAGLPRLELLAVRQAGAVRRAEERLEQTTQEDRRLCRLIRYPAADRSFSGIEALLARDVRGWLKTLAFGG